MTRSLQQTLLIGALGALALTASLAQDATTPASPESASDSAFASEEAKRSYAVGLFFGQRAKTSNPDGDEIDTEAVIAGLKDVLDGEKSLDYAFGVAVGQDLMRNEIPVGVDGVLDGVRAALGDGEPKLSEAEVQTEMNALREVIQQRQMAARQKEQEEWQARMEEVAPINKEEGEKFLAENAKSEGVETTESGLQFKVIEPGEGEETPSASDRVSVNYKGSLLDGTVFDQSPEGQPRQFAVGGVIQGWQEGLQLMKKGSKYTFWIPGDLAYGMNPRPGGEIEAMDTLVFDVELVDIQAAPSATTPPVRLTPGNAGAGAPQRKPVTAVTPPVSIEIPPRKTEGEEKDEAEEKKDADGEKAE
ncbi:hypothetical protein BH23VER1_BH23VER1_26990 [soil metagenome]